MCHQTIQYYTVVVLLHSLLCCSRLLPLVRVKNICFKLYHINEHGELEQGKEKKSDGRRAYNNNI